MKKRTIITYLLFCIMIFGLSLYLRHIHNLFFIIGMLLCVVIILKLLMLIESENNYLHMEAGTDIELKISSEKLKERIGNYFSQNKKNKVDVKENFAYYRKSVFIGHKIIEHILVIDEENLEKTQRRIEKSLDIIKRYNEKMIREKYFYTRHTLIAIIMLNSKDIQNSNIRCEEIYTVTTRMGRQENYGLFIPIFIDKTTNTIYISGIETKNNTSKLLYYQQQKARIIKLLNKIINKKH